MLRVSHLLLTKDQPILKDLSFEVAAVKYQLAIVFMIAGTASLTCMIVTLLAARRCFSSEL